jgi:hypothetical protein
MASLWVPHRKVPHTKADDLNGHEQTTLRLLAPVVRARANRATLVYMSACPVSRSSLQVVWTISGWDECFSSGPFRFSEPIPVSP